MPRAKQPTTPEQLITVYLPTSAITPSPLNPRKEFPSDDLEELAASIRQHGLIQPIVVRATPDPHNPLQPTYHIVAGERRWRAAQLANLPDVPVIVRDIDDSTHLELALIENLARKDLDPIEEAAGLRQLIDLTGATQKTIAQKLGRSQPAIANSLRLLDLDEELQDAVHTRQLSAAHARALLKWKDYPRAMNIIAATAIEEGLSSKALEAPILHGAIINKLRNDASTKALSTYGPFTTTCRACPFGAYLTSGDYGNAVCLKPEHYAELEEIDSRARLARESKARAAAATALLAKQGKTPTEVGNAAFNTIAAEIPSTKGMQYGTYITIHPGTAPPGCTEDCPCRSAALDATGDLVQICTKPGTMRFKTGQQTRDANKTLNTTSAHLTEDAIVHTANPATLNPLAIAFIAARATPTTPADPFHKAWTRHAAGHPIPSTNDGTGHINLAAAYAKLPPETILTITAETIIRTEYHPGSEAYRWMSPQHIRLHSTLASILNGTMTLPPPQTDTDTEDKRNAGKLHDNFPPRSPTTLAQQFEDDELNRHKKGETWPHEIPYNGHTIPATLTRTSTNRVLLTAPGQLQDGAPTFPTIGQAEADYATRVLNPPTAPADLDEYLQRGHTITTAIWLLTTDTAINGAPDLETTTIAQTIDTLIVLRDPDTAAAALSHYSDAIPQTIYTKLAEDLDSLERRLAAYPPTPTPTYEPAEATP